MTMAHLSLAAALAVAALAAGTAAAAEPTVEPAPACVSRPATEGKDCVGYFDDGRELRMQLAADGSTVLVGASVVKQGFAERTVEAKDKNGKTVQKVEKVPAWVVDPTATVWLETTDNLGNPDEGRIAQSEGTTGQLSRESAWYRACSDSNPSGTVCTYRGHVLFP